MEFNIEALDILINQCWKALPIFEGKDLSNKVVYTPEEALENYRKHLSFLITKVSGATKVWSDNQYYVELLYLLNGMQDFTIDDHDRVKYIVNHCITLINNMKKVVVSDES